MVNRQLETAATTRPKRSSELIASFVDGFAVGWHMALKESFRRELDIELTERKKGKTTWYEWTQGPYYCFSEGQLIYDAQDAYGSCWQTALEKIHLACHIVAAKPNVPVKVDNDVTGKSTYRVLEGFVRFVVYKPDNDRSRLVPHVGYELSQNEFVNFLKTGTLQ
jgi:hypothetical protein